MFKDEFFEYQPSDYTCGPTVLRMLMRAALIEVEPIEELCKILNVTQERGTNIESLNQYVREKGLLHDREVVVGDRKELSDIQSLIGQDFIVAVNFIDPIEKEGHFAIVREVTESEIILADPSAGNPYIVYKDQFVWRSQYENPPTERWLIAIK